MKNLAQKVSEKLLNLATVHAKNIAAWADDPYVAAPRVFPFMALLLPYVTSILNLHSKIGVAQK